MPRCGSQIILCDVPIRFDTYEGCGHACSYCFVSRKTNIAKIKTGESVDTLRRFISGGRSGETEWCDWDIPLHWGGMSDPFQPAEKIHRRSLEALEVFAETQYPFIVSTKSALIADEPYLSLVKKSNCVVQFSIASPKYDKVERGAATYEERLEAAAKIAPYRRVVFRVQPYIPEIFTDVIKGIKRFAAIGAHGIVVEGMKYTRPVNADLVRIGNDFCYPVSILFQQFQSIKAAAHKYGLKFYCGENRLRALGDELCCCGVEGMGWRVNTANLNHYLFSPETFEYTDRMKEKGTANTFKCLEQSTLAGKEMQFLSYADKMDGCALKPYAYKDGTPAINKTQAEKLRLYLRKCLKESGKKAADIDRHIGTKGMAGHYFGAAQWEYPTLEAYNKMRQIMPTLGDYFQVLRAAGVNTSTMGKIYGVRTSLRSQDKRPNGGDSLML